MSFHILSISPLGTSLVKEITEAWSSDPLHVEVYHSSDEGRAELSLTTCLVLRVLATMALTKEPMNPLCQYE